MDMVLKYQGMEIRTATKGDEMMFAIIDICNVLGIVDHAQAAERLENDEKGLVKIPTPKGMQEAICCNESGLYNLIFRSEKPEAREFRRWVTHDVLPSIRKHGFYVDDSWKMSTQELCDMFLMPQKKMMEIIGSVLPKYWYHCNSIDRKKPLELNALEAFLVILKASKNGVNLYEMSIPEPVKKIAQGMGHQLSLDYNKYLCEKSILPRKK